MKNYLMMGSAAILSMAMVVAACSDDETTNGTATGTGTGTGTGQGGQGGDGGSGIPEVPTLGAQVDRMGRPAVNTAANTTFGDNATRSAAEIDWNSNADPTTWVASYVADVAPTLAVLDALDETCGNQFGYNDAAGDGMRYGTTATVLTNDWLIVDSLSTECDQYLGVEAAALGAIPAGKCGGRTPSMDVIETTYSALAAGVFTGVDDTITAGPQSQVTTFPYLAPPN